MQKVMVRVMMLFVFVSMLLVVKTWVGSFEDYFSILWIIFAFTLLWSVLDLEENKS